MSDLDAYLAALKQALAELRKTRAYAFANGHQCSLGSDPRLDWVMKHDEYLMLAIEELTLRQNIVRIEEAERER